MSTTSLARLEPAALAPAVELRADEHPAVVYLARLSPGSRRTMAAALRRVACLVTGEPERPDAHLRFAWAALRYQHTAAIRARLAETAAPATANKVLAALRGVLREAWRLGQLEAEDYRRAVDLEPVRGTALPRGRALNRGEVLALVDACKRAPSPAGARDVALLAVLYGGGLRRAEVVALNLADFDADTGALVVRHGKGNRARTVYATNGSRAALQAWLTVRGLEPGPLFLRARKGGTLTPAGLTPQAVLVILEHRAQAAGVARFSPHDLRRTFISELLDGGADLATVRALAGHAHVETTARYDRRGEQAKRRAAEMLHFPYATAAA
jgi:integrase